GLSKRKGTVRGRFSHEEKSSSDRCRCCGDSWDDFGGAHASPPGSDGSALGSAYVKLRAGRGGGGGGRKQLLKKRRKLWGFPEGHAAIRKRRRQWWGERGAVLSG